MSIQKKLYEHIASMLMAHDNCQNELGAATNEDTADHWQDMSDMHEENIETLVNDFMPHGSGFDSGVKFDPIESSANKLVFHTSFHHMDQYGGYDGWSDHTVTVSPSLAFGIEIDITPDKNYVAAKDEEFKDAMKEYCTCGSEDIYDHDDVCECAEAYSHDHESFLEYAYDVFNDALDATIQHDEKGFRRID